jgi:hypothetical protein
MLFHSPLPAIYGSGAGENEMTFAQVHINILIDYTHLLSLLNIYYSRPSTIPWQKARIYHRTMEYNMVGDRVQGMYHKRTRAS